MTGENNQKPTLLMVSHCLPDPRSGSRGRRCWQLLEAAKRVYQVWLVACVDNQVHLNHWRRVADHVQNVTLLTELNTPELLRSTRDWRQQIAFDAMLCSNPRVWQQAHGLNLPFVICDLDVPDSELHRARAQHAGLGRRWWHLRQAQQAQNLETHAASHSDVVLLSRADDLAHVTSRSGEICIAPRYNVEGLEPYLQPHPITQPSGMLVSPAQFDLSDLVAEAA